MIAEPTEAERFAEDLTAILDRVAKGRARLAQLLDPRVSQHVDLIRELDFFAGIAEFGLSQAHRGGRQAHLTEALARMETYCRLLEQAALLLLESPSDLDH